MKISILMRLVEDGDDEPLYEEVGSEEPTYLYPGRYLLAGMAKDKSRLPVLVSLEVQQVLAGQGRKRNLS